jgi:response regulator RpfG family c-di-GMP phosphodiesterase
MKEGSLAVCEVASRLADALGFEPEVRRHITEVYERWDGKGVPSRIPAARVSVPARVVVAETAETLMRLGDLDAARSVVAERAGRAFDPEIAACFARRRPGSTPTAGGACCSPGSSTTSAASA